MDYFSGYMAVQDSLFITIPSELVSAVFGYLAAKDLVVCSSVCRKWRQYSTYESVWKALCYRNWGWQKEIDWSEDDTSKPEFSWKNMYRSFVNVYLVRSRYYHGKLTREQTEALLKNKGKGSFLVRDSSHKGHYVISVVSSTGEILHLLVIKIGKYKGYFIETENSIYSTISELIKCHKSQLKPNSAVPKNQLASIKEMDAQPASLALTMVEDVTNEKLAPAHAIERGLLHKLCKHGLNKMVASLFGPQSKFTSGVNARYKGKTPLHYLAKGASLALHIEPFLEIAQVLHKQGADFNIRDLKGCAPIHYLITDLNTSYRMVNTFIECGATIDGSEGVNSEGYNALGLGISRGSTIVMQLLLTTAKIEDAGAFIGNVITQDTLIHLAVMTEQLTVVKTVLHNCHKTNINALNRCKVTPLHAVVSFDQDWTNLAQFGKPRKKAGYSYEIVNYLLASHNADPNLKDEEGKTPLHYACANGHRTSTVCLLNHGALASLTIKDNYGRYPEDYCRDRLKSPSSAVQWHMQALKERIHAGYKVLTVEMLTDRVETHYSEILKELTRYKASANGKK
jgi:hypothetical protein